MLDDLVDAIDTIKKRIAIHRASLSSSEARTRTALIDPLLTALGWNTADPALVTPEYITNTGDKPDYALLNTGPTPAAFIEAKKLGEKLEGHIKQMSNYSNLAGVKWAGLTNGDDWELYEVFSITPSPIEDRRRMRISVSTTPTHECALNLLLLWRPNLETVNPVSPEVPLLAPLPASLLTSVPMETPSADTGRVSLQAWATDANVYLPSLIQFPDGSEQPIKYWRELVTLSSKWLWSQSRLTKESLPVPSGSKRFIVNTNPVHGSGKNFLGPKNIEGTPLVVETHMSGDEAKQNTVKLFKHCGIDLATVKVARPSLK